MNVSFSKRFDNHYSSRIKNQKSLEKRFQERFQLFVKNPHDPVLRLHKLKGTMLGLWSYSVTGDVRAVVETVDDFQNVKFVNVGTHNQVY